MMILRSLCITVGFIVICVTSRSLPPIENTTVLFLHNFTRTENPDHVIWTKLEGNHLQDFQPHEESTPSVENFSLEDFSPEQDSFNDKDIAQLIKQDQNAVNSSDELLADVETTLSANDPSNNDENDEFATEADTEEFLTSSSDNEVFELLKDLDSSNFSDSNLDVSNITGESVILQLLAAGNGTVNSFLLNTTGLDEETEVEIFQDVKGVSPTGFEFLIDSEATRNLLLAQLINSSNFLIGEDGQDLNDTTNNDFVTEDESLAALRNGSEFDLNKTTDTNDLDGESDVINEMNSSNLTEVIKSEGNDPKCPPPGWCVFWFLALDTCAENNHCLGSRICCKSGCSMTCLEVTSEQMQESEK